MRLFLLKKLLRKTQLVNLYLGAAPIAKENYDIVTVSDCNNKNCDSSDQLIFISSISIVSVDQ